MSLFLHVSPPCLGLAEEKSRFVPQLSELDDEDVNKAKGYKPYLKIAPKLSFYHDFHCSLISKLRFSSYRELRISLATWSLVRRWLRCGAPWSATDVSVFEYPF